MATGTVELKWTAVSSTAIRFSTLTNGSDETLYTKNSSSSTSSLATLWANATQNINSNIVWVFAALSVNSIYELTFMLLVVNSTINIIYADDTGLHQYISTNNSETFTITNPQPISNYTSSLSQVIVNATSDSLQSVTYENTQYTTFPATILLNTDSNLYVVGKPTNITLTDGQNMKSVVDGANTYNTFPATISNVYGNKTLVLNGEDDKTITVNYTNTSVPVVTDS